MYATQPKIGSLLSSSLPMFFPFTALLKATFFKQCTEEAEGGSRVLKYPEADKGTKTCVSSFTHKISSNLRHEQHTYSTPLSKDHQFKSFKLHSWLKNRKSMWCISSQIKDTDKSFSSSTPSYTTSMKRRQKNLLFLLFSFPL